MSAPIAPDAAIWSLRWGDRVLAPAEPRGAILIEEMILCPLTGPAALAVEILAGGGPGGADGLAVRLSVDDWRFDVAIDCQAVAFGGRDLRSVLLTKLKRALAREAERLEGDLDAMLDEDVDNYQGADDYDFASPAVTDASGGWEPSFPPMSYGAYVPPLMVAPVSPGRSYIEAAPATARRLGSNVVGGYVMDGYLDNTWGRDGAANAVYEPLAIPVAERSAGADRLLALDSPAQLAAERLLRAKEMIQCLDEA